MPRFRLTTYLRDTFGVEDLRSFRLCGMDEVGRGSYAGPLVAAAVVLPPRFQHPLLRDSKLLCARQRASVGAVIRRRAVAWMVAEISVADINHRGLGWANLEIFRRLVDLVEADGYCCDGRLRIDATRTVHCLVKGDNLVPAISAASIIAKVHRDAIMTAMHDGAPPHTWATYKACGARAQRNAIISHGPHPESRNVRIDGLLQLGRSFDFIEA